jgi:stress response protein YsnF
VTVERRQPIETAAAPGTGAFEERVIEVRETAEEPVVTKTAHVAEEGVIGREATERTETVKDTVRHEDVEVTDDAGVRR